MKRANLLRHKIANYRRLLEEGIGGDFARLYLQEIVKAQTELDVIEKAEVTPE
jgi:hypothetical protein